MATFHAVLTGELGYEFALQVAAVSRKAARAKLERNYPESRVVQLVTAREAAFLQHQRERFHQRAYDNGDQY